MTAPNNCFRRQPRTAAALLLTAAFMLLIAPAGARLQERPKPAAPAAASPVPAAAQTDYYGVYMGPAKVGSLVLERQNAAKTPDGKAAVRSDSAMKLDLTVLGAAATTTSTSTTWSEPKSGRPLRIESKTESAGRVTSVTATYTDRTVTYSAVVQGTPQNGTLTLKDGEKFLFDPTTGGAEFAPKVGMKLAGKVFVPDALRLMDSRIEVVAEETVSVGGQSVKAFKVNDVNDIATSTLYMTGGGDLLRIDGPFGMQMRKEAKEVALAAPGKDDPRPDLARAVGITPTGEKMENPRETRRVRYEIRGVTRDLPPSDGVQSVEYRAGAASAEPGRENQKVAVVTVNAAPLPPSSTATVFADPTKAPAKLRPYLQSTVYVAASDALFQRLAAEVVGQEKDVAKAAAKVAEYVHRTMTPDPSIAALRTAKDIQADPRGVCRDYTTFFTAISRAAGIPTRQCVGIAYANGMFLYHAWPEVWVGGETWVALEPTWGAPFADATHIKLAQGEITDVFSFAADMGKYQIQVLEVK
ncbi:MAG TPA: transglutaminase-like domain-containing protein [Armatimonadaceae bacterium]|nr:transglutaminase-like domain-containing protein [Armatimonadaceae bacterium]